MNRLIWHKNDTPKELLPLLNTLEDEYPIGDFGRGLKIKFRRIEDKETVSRVVRSRGEVLVEYSTVAAAARGIGSAFAKLEGEERTSFSTLGIMLDVSRNMVMTVDNLKMWFRRMALSGCNLVMLYTEDTYVLDDEPFFGYMRGGYTMEEIKELDAYAKTLGIELVGCIQTLGHLEQILRWGGAYGNITDTPRVVMVDSPKTYALIEKMIRFWSEALSSRRIHIGMDETHDLGRGKFMDAHGYERPVDIFNRHLGKVHEICRKNGLRPMLWSDMYFRLSSPRRTYYDFSSPIPKDIQSAIPKDVQLVYWDYYHTDIASYDGMLYRHRELGFEPVMASGIWSWCKLWYDHGKTADTAVPCIKSCRKNHVKELFFTMWGDDGAYCNYNSTLAGIVWAADLAFGVEPEDTARTSARFEAVCGSDFEAHILGGTIAEPLKLANGKMFEFNPAMLLWDDPLMGIVFDDCRRADPEFDLKLIDRYEDILLHILPLQDDCMAGDFEHLANTLELIIRKLQLRGALLAAYAHDDRIALRQIAGSLIPAVSAALDEFDSTFRRQWLECAKPFGLETIQIRNGGLAARLKELEIRIREYLDGDIPEIEELENRISGASEIHNTCNWYGPSAYGTTIR